ncbi:MAG: TldD/PmbA family protein [Rhodobacteraceae bacterium]|nr:TldD/PmbA family protein [Paracoccaceae bacterium]
MTPDPADLTARLLEAARAAGAEAADAVAVEATSVSVAVRDGKLEEAERAEGVEVGLRVLMGQRQACVAASDTSADTFAMMAERAVAMAREAPEDPWIGLADPSEIATEWDLVALDLIDPGPEPAPAALEEAARDCEAAARAVPGITRTDRVGAGYSRRRLHIAASNGFSGGYGRTGHGISCTAITGDGTAMERDHFGDSRLHAADLMAPSEIGRIAAERTLARAGARQPKTGRFPVLFDERVAASLVSHLLGAISGSAIARGASWARGLLGQPVLPDGLDLTENPLRLRGPASRPFDAEGLATRPRTIVAGGILTGWTLDLATARKLGLASTASAARGPAAPPSPAVSNVALTQGTRSPAELMRDMGTGLLVTSMIGATINPTTGDYSRGAAGLWIENGEPAYPVNELTVAGNLIGMLRSVVPANDARPHLASVVPSLLVEGLTIAGG